MFNRYSLGGLGVVMQLAFASGVQSPELLRAFGQAVQKLQARDHKLWSYLFKASSNNHPRIDTHELMATELTQFLREEVLK
jgi:hypothetical protein